MIKVLINAYACSPNMGSEPGMGWNWCMNLAKYCELFIITEGEFRNKIEAVVPTLPLGKNMHFYYNPVTPKIRQMCWNQGDWRFYAHYKKWQKSTANIARKICEKEKIDILHQLNMIGFREPGYLWEVSRETGIPFVWGPIDAKENFPMEYTNGASLKIKAFLYLKNIITKLQLKYSKRVHQAANSASLIISGTSNSVLSLKKYFNLDSHLINETGTYPVCEKAKQNNKKTFDILWVGKADFRKQLSLAIRSVKLANKKDIRLHIVGSGNMEQYLQEAKTLDIAEACVFHGSVSHEEVLRLMSQSDLFLFTSVAEGTPHVVLEAIGCNLPILCFDTCGQGDSVTEDIGIKISLSNPNQSIKDFANKIGYLYEHRELLEQKSKKCLKRAKELSWDNKAKLMVDLYTHILKNKVCPYVQ